MKKVKKFYGGLMGLALLLAACAPAPAKETAPAAPTVKEAAPAVKEAAVSNPLRGIKGVRLRLFALLRASSRGLKPEGLVNNL